MEPVATLVVDENPFFLRTLAQHIRAMASICLVAACAETADALLLAKAHAPDLVIANVRLRNPPMAEFCRRLKAMAPRAKIIVYADAEPGLYASNLAGCIDLCLAQEDLFFLLEHHIRNHFPPMDLP